MIYRTIVADPPWRYDQNSSARGKAEYPTMTTGEIAMLRVADHAEQDAHLWLWTTNAFMEEAHRVCRAWGFRPLTIVTWCKPGPGVGHYVRNNTEHVIFASKGRAQTPLNKPLSSWYEWPRGAHSEKPQGFYELAEQVSPGPRLEIFARRQRLGWDTWGDEAFCHVDLLPSDDGMCACRGVGFVHGNKIHSMGCPAAMGERSTVVSAAVSERGAQP